MVKSLSIHEYPKTVFIAIIFFCCAIIVFCGFKAVSSSASEATDKPGVYVSGLRIDSPEALSNVPRLTREEAEKITRETGPGFKLDPFDGADMPEDEEIKGGFSIAIGDFYENYNIYYQVALLRLSDEPGAGKEKIAETIAPEPVIIRPGQPSLVSFVLPLPPHAFGGKYELEAGLFRQDGSLIGRDAIELGLPAAGNMLRIEKLEIYRLNDDGALQFSPGDEIGGIITVDNPGDRIDAYPRIVVKKKNQFGPIIRENTPDKALIPSGSAKLPLDLANYGEPGRYHVSLQLFDGESRAISQIEELTFWIIGQAIEIADIGYLNPPLPAPFDSRPSPLEFGITALSGQNEVAAELEIALYDRNSRLLAKDKKEIIVYPEKRASSTTRFVIPAFAETIKSFFVRASLFIDGRLASQSEYRYGSLPGEEREGQETVSPKVAKDGKRAVNMAAVVVPALTFLALALFLMMLLIRKNKGS